MNNDQDDQSFSDTGYDPVRERLDIVVGALVTHEQTVYRIEQVMNFESVMGTAVESGRSAQLRVGELRPLADENSKTAIAQSDLAEIADDDWRIAQQRYAAIEPFVGGIVVGRDEASRRAETVGVNTATLYRWLKLYQSRGVVTDLIPKKRGWRDGKGRIGPAAEAVIEEVIDDVYLTPQRTTAQQTISEVKRRCHERDIEPPSANTVRQRIAKIPERTRLRKRGHKELASSRFHPVPGSFPNADFPLSVVQIDHTPADIILVDDVFRKPIGRPWITLAIDVSTRIVTGYYLSFDAPSETSVGLCVAHSALPKEGWLAMHQVNAEWPVWGFPQTIHVDNGSDFRSQNFERSCMQYGINLEFRPVKVPRYGGHIERLLGTLLKEIHDLPGTTFSSIKEKGEYDPEKNATMTFSEFEEWFVAHITKLYHHRLHASLGMTPARQWEIGVFGNAETPGVGLPRRPADPLTVQLDFMPAFERTVQPVGVTIDDRTYYAEALRPWISAKDSRTGAKRKFVFRRDPRDISTIWFFDPDLKQYFKVPFANLSLPAISLWEYRQIRDKLKREGHASVNESQLLHALTEQRSRIESTKEKTKTARRSAQRRKQHEKNVSPATPTAKKTPSESIHSTPSAIELLDGDILSDFGAIT